MKTLIAPRMERCIGCHSCSLACARMVHKHLSWDKAGIRIVSSGGLSTGFEAKTCLACDPAPCADACPTGAYSQRRGGGVVVRRNSASAAGSARRRVPSMPYILTPLGSPLCAFIAGDACLSVPMTALSCGKQRAPLPKGRRNRRQADDKGPFPGAEG